MNWPDGKTKLGLLSVSCKGIRVECACSCVIMGASFGTWVRIDTRLVCMALNGTWTGLTSSQFWTLSRIGKLASCEGTWAQGLSTQYGVGTLFARRALLASYNCTVTVGRIGDCTDVISGHGLSGNIAVPTLGHIRGHLKVVLACWKHHKGCENLLPERTCVT
ncbi:unnamed protein product [Ostreobium quekettii]|uniref:Uncharacterized protein n=1 Tax=Ostreobium quekettii TaxID=121088 RepID=A0A8S1J4V4_9CHLO|nr:unnamed protein product [Ostreobium quekettii]